MRLTGCSSWRVALPQRKRQRGAGYFEFAVVSIIFAILCGVLLQKMHFYQQEAERLAVEQVVTSVRAALAAQAASLYLRGNHAEIAALGSQNPMQWLERPPPNYAGELDATRALKVAPGNWYFDRSALTLTYMLNNEEFFGRKRANRLNFKVRFAQSNLNLTENHVGPRLSGVTLEQIE